MFRPPLVDLYCWGKPLKRTSKTIPLDSIKFFSCSRHLGLPYSLYQVLVLLHLFQSYPRPRSLQLLLLQALQQQRDWRKRRWLARTRAGSVGGLAISLGLMFRWKHRAAVACCPRLRTSQIVRFSVKFKVVCGNTGSRLTSSLASRCSLYGVMVADLSTCR